MKSIDLTKYYAHPLHEGEDTILLVSDEVADALEQFVREENNAALRRYRAKAYYSFDCGDGIEHHILFREETPEELYEKKADHPAAQPCACQTPCKTEPAYLRPLFPRQKLPGDCPGGTGFGTGGPKVPAQRSEAAGGHSEKSLIL